ncbi:hypothetical protein [Oceanibaculum nanhaiense]|uniref:hypothetical protein n=1 Tax=Oceanibaculum nanhaiense TaxID=1909734 RepID=UPI003D2B56EE
MSVEFFNYASATLLAVVGLLVLGNIWVLAALRRRYLRLAEIERAFAVEATVLRSMLMASLNDVQTSASALKAEAQVGNGGGDVVH